MKNIEITIAKWMKAGLASAAFCAFFGAVGSHFLGTWHSLMVLPIGFIIGATVQNARGDSTGRWPARTAAVLTILAGVLAKAGSFYFRVELDYDERRKLDNRLSEAVFDFTFSNLDRSDAILFAIAAGIAYLTAFRSDRETGSEPPPLEPAAADLTAGTPVTPAESGLSVGTSTPAEEKYSELEVKRARAESLLTFARIAMFIIGGGILYGQADQIINARKQLDKYIRLELRQQVPLNEIDRTLWERQMDEGVRTFRLWAGGVALIGIAHIAAGLLIYRFPIAATSTSLILFAGDWAMGAYQGYTINPGAKVIKILIITLLAIALVSFIQFRRECLRWIRQSGPP